MMDIIKSFLVSLGYEVDQASERKFNSGIAEATKKVTIFAAAISAMAAGVWASVMKTAESLRELSAISARANVPVDKIEELGYIAEQTDSSTQAVRASLENLSKAAGEAALGVGRGAQAFEKLGIKAKGADGKLKDTYTLLTEIGDKIQDMSRTQQTAFLERLGIDRTMVQMLTSDVSGLRDEYQKMYSVAGVDANEAAEAASDFMNEWGKLKTMSAMLYRAVNVGFMMKFKNDLIRLRKFMIENAERIKAVFQAIMSLIVRIAGVIGSAVMRIISWIQKIADWYSTLDDRTKKLIMTVGGLIAAWKLLNLQFLATPLGMLIAALVGLFLVVDDLLTYLEGGETAIDWSKWEPQIEAITNVFMKLREVLSSVFEGHGDKIRNFALAFLALSAGPKLLFKVFRNLAGSVKLLFSPFLLLAKLLKSNLSAIWRVIGAAGKFGVAFWNVGKMLGGGVISGIGKLGTALAGFGKLLMAKVVPAVGKLTIALLANPITWIVLAVAALAAGLVWLVRNWDRVKEAVIAFVETIPGIGKVFDGVSDAVTALRDILKGIRDFVVSIFKGDIEGAVNAIESVFGGLFDFIESGFKIVMGIIEGAIALVRKAINGVKELLGLGEDDEETKQRHDSKLKSHFDAGKSKPTARKLDDEFGMTPAQYDAAHARYVAAQTGESTADHINTPTSLARFEDLERMNNYPNTPPPQTEAAISHETNNSQEFNFNNETTVTVHEARDAQATGRAVEDAVNNVNRNTASQTTPYVRMRDRG